MTANTLLITEPPHWLKNPLIPATDSVKDGTLNIC